MTISLLVLLPFNSANAQKGDSVSDCQNKLIYKTKDIKSPNNDLSYCPFSNRSLGLSQDMANLNLDHFTYDDWEIFLVNFENSSLRYANLSHKRLTGSNFSRVNLESANLSSVETNWASTTNFDGASFRRAYALGANFFNGSFKDCDFSFANFADSEFKNSDISGFFNSTDLTGTDLSQSIFLPGIRSKSIIGTPLLPKDWQIVGGFLIGPEANLGGQNLANLDLSSSKLNSSILTNTNLGKTDLYWADLSGVKSGGVIGNPILPKYWKLVNGYLVGPKSDLTGANLTGGNLKGVSLEGAVIAGAKLSGAKIDESNHGKSVIGAPKSLPSGWSIYKGKLKH